ncbi:hypothetical protein B6N60_01696 [Richelia sinica FACHB-800]|uniref:Uncharacterized protein n=1 Tax=Richelia sinica FACHB-800 TaxID=1357546 RepID=A0A975Y4B7_9NOST|nr:hypothetical protein B6N60_01696 [Richelia sinica FACHB-800]
MSIENISFLDSLILSISFDRVSFFARITARLPTDTTNLNYDYFP